MRTRAITFCLGTIFMLASAGAEAQEGDVKYRQSIMGAIGGHAGAIAEIAYQSVPYVEHLAGHAEALHALSTLIPTAFRERALTEDPPTRARPDIWERWGEFEEKAATFEKAASAFAMAVAEEDEIGMAETLDPMWDACDGCHKVFRKKRR